MDEIRKIINMVESHINEEGDLVSPSLFVGADPVRDIADIISSLNVLIAVLDDDTVDSTERERTISAIHNVKQNLNDAVQSLHSELTEELGTEGMAPKVDSKGHRSYAVKSASSYSARKGFTG